jgi:CRISPR-associated endonuclease/helicase Cas3
MRVLVEQTERALQSWIASAGLPVSLFVLMGGVRANRWVAHMDEPAILVGTQDMLLSRALNRGYASGRALWPMEFGLLHHDALWVLDEVQLMDVGLATSAQLAAFRQRDAAADQTRPAHTWWMSATLQPRWLATVDRPEPTDPPLAIPRETRKGGLFDVRKRLSRNVEAAEPKSIAELVRDRHEAGGVTLVIVNRVRTAVDVFDALDAAFSEGKGSKKRRRPDAPDLRLVHSRFRGHERVKWVGDFLRRDAPIPESGRIVIATQVVEAGVDLSARLLVTELAPWSSLVQRFGRVARYEGQTGEVVVSGRVPVDAKGAAPYGAPELSAAHEGIERLLAREGDASLRSLEAFEEQMLAESPEFLARLYPYEPLHVLRRRDLDDLFDTSADLSGADLDVSRFIRSGDERDVTVFWRSLEPVSGAVRLTQPPQRAELCPVPIAEIRGWKGSAYVFDYLDGDWRRRAARGLVPGMVVLLDAKDGGYSPGRGWDGRTAPVECVPLEPEASDKLARASSAEDLDDMSEGVWKTIATHGRETEEQARALCDRLGVRAETARIVALAARWHDAGKVHPVFQDAITMEARGAVRLGARRDLAKAPDASWRQPPYPGRPGFRHELASTLALFEVLRGHDRWHPALLGPHRDLLTGLGLEPEPAGDAHDHPLAEELAGLSSDEFDLLAWLVCTHHGKVRCVWTSTPRDQEQGHSGIHGVCEGDSLPALLLADDTGSLAELPSLKLSLAAAEMGVGTRYGASWGERVAGLVSRHGPFALAFLEAVLRIADWRASALESEDPIG